jgi:hypothetical protein
MTPVLFHPIRKKEQINFENSASSACPACPVAPADGTGVGALHRTGARDQNKPDITPLALQHNLEKHKRMTVS